MRFGSSKLAKQLTWFSESVKDIQMLRIEENSDLGKAIKILICDCDFLIQSKIFY